MIQREAARCKEYAMPYILNNSAISWGLHIIAAWEPCVIIFRHWRRGY
jgi:hypothetical protein